MTTFKNQHITEIMPADMPDWMWDAIEEGRLALRSMEKVARYAGRIKELKRTSQYWKDEHLAGNDRITELETLTASLGDRTATAEAKLKRVEECQRYCITRDGGFSEAEGGRAFKAADILEAIK